MINLEKISGLPLEVTEDYKLKFLPPLAQAKPTFARKFSEMEPVLMDKVESAPDETYVVYRGIHLPDDDEAVKQEKLSYDVTILPPLKLGREFNKTLGHYHANIPGKNISHPELYEILHGHALFILQKTDDEFKKVSTVLIMEAHTGDKVVYPPNYGHIMVNLGTGPLVTANWISTDYKALYEPIKQMHGMAYYAVFGQGKLFELIANKNYGAVPQPRIISNKFMNYFPVTGSKPMYASAMLNPKNLEFLSNPEKYAVELSSITS